MPHAHTHGIEIAYETYGDRTARPLVLLRGLGTHMTHWHPELLTKVVEAGHYVAVFDHRDVGLSTHFSDHGAPDLGAVVAAAVAGEPPPLAYQISDMANDVIGLMDALELPSAHIAGISMGGMIVQAAALEHPGRVRSMTSVMSNTSNPDLPRPAPEVMAALNAPAPREREAYIDHTVQTSRVFASTGFPFDEAEVRRTAALAFDRAFDPEGVARQMGAIMAAPNRVPALASLETPSLVIHGDADPLVPLEGGLATAKSIPGADLVVIPGMGHDLPRGAWPAIVDALARHTAAAEAVWRA